MCVKNEADIKGEPPPRQSVSMAAGGGVVRTFEDELKFITKISPVEYRIE